VVDPAAGYEDVLITQAAAFDAAFDANARECAAAGARRCGVEDLGDAYDRVAAEVETRPLPGGVRDTGPGELATAAIQTTYGSDGWQELGPALAAALDGDGGPLWSLAASYYDAGDFTSYAAVVCLDEPPPPGAEAYRRFAQRAAARAPRFGAAVANELAVCAEWPVTASSAAPDTTPADAPPVLVVGNTGDPATPYANAVAVAEALPGAALLTVERDGHTAYLSDTCASLRVDRYLVDLELPPRGATCG
jgi:pimeloyl-ACP methyl ester carboxylesterase